MRLFLLSLRQYKPSGSYMMQRQAAQIRSRCAPAALLQRQRHACAVAVTSRLRSRRATAAAAREAAGAAPSPHPPLALPAAVLVCPGFLADHRGPEGTVLAASLRRHFERQLLAAAAAAARTPADSAANAPAPAPALPIVEVLPITKAEWYPTLRGGSFVFYTDALARGVEALSARAGGARVALAALSAAGWIARLALGSKPYEGGLSFCFFVSSGCGSARRGRVYVFVLCVRLLADSYPLRHSLSPSAARNGGSPIFGGRARLRPRAARRRARDARRAALFARGVPVWAVGGERASARGERGRKVGRFAGAKSGWCSCHAKAPRAKHTPPPLASRSTPPPGAARHSVPERLSIDGGAEGGGAAAGGEALPADVRGSSLRLANFHYPDAASVAPTQVACVVGSVPVGSTATPLQRLAGLFGAGGLNSSSGSSGSSADDNGGGGAVGSGWRASVDDWLASASYEAAIGRPDADGDGVTPRESALLPGAAHVLLPGCWHSPGGGRRWYGSEGVVPLWAPYLVGSGFGGGSGGGGATEAAAEVAAARGGSGSGSGNAASEAP